MMNNNNIILQSSSSNHVGNNNVDIDDKREEELKEDDALAEMFGLKSLQCLLEASSSSSSSSVIGTIREDHWSTTTSTEQQSSAVPLLFHNDEEDNTIDMQLRRDTAHEIYEATSVYRFPKIFSLSAEVMRRITLELIYGSSTNDASTTTTTTTQKVNMLPERTYETIGTERYLTRMENFVHTHSQWKDLCYGYLQKLVSSVMGEEYILYKEKLNFKPPGGSGFAPHVDTPSLRAAFAATTTTIIPSQGSSQGSKEVGPQTFVTVMVAIDTMTKANGCLRIVEGGWYVSEREKNTQHHQKEQQEETVIVEVLPQVIDGNPDGDGRAGAIPQSVSSQLNFIDVECDGGDIVMFHGWTPHRSSKNTTAFSRRAVFLTYNPLREGDFRHEYYLRMKQLRQSYSNTHRKLYQSDYQMDLDALRTIPKI